MLAAILESDDPERLYTGLSLLVSAASEGREARALLTFGALGAVLDPDLGARVGAHVVEREAFGPARIVYGSDFPVCLVAASYARVKRVVDDYCAELSAPERAGILGGNAIAFYQLPVGPNSR